METSAGVERPSAPEKPVTLRAGELRPCDLCGKGLMHAGVPLLYRITFETFGVELQAVRDRMGLQLLFAQGGRDFAGRLAEVFAPTGAIATRLADADSLMVCQECWLEHTPDGFVLALMAQTAAERAELRRKLATGMKT